MRDYESALPVINHQYNFQARAYNFTDATTKANNTASQSDVSVDPTLQVKRNHDVTHVDVKSPWSVMQQHLSDYASDMRAIPAV